MKFRNSICIVRNKQTVGLGLIYKTLWKASWAQPATRWPTLPLLASLRAHTHPHPHIPGRPLPASQCFLACLPPPHPPFLTVFSEVSCTHCPPNVMACVVEQWSSVVTLKVIHIVSFFLGAISSERDILLPEQERIISSRVTVHLSLCLKCSAGLSQSEQWCQECVCCNLWQWVLWPCLCVVQFQGSKLSGPITSVCHGLGGNRGFPRWPWAVCFLLVKLLADGETRWGNLPTVGHKYSIEWGLSIDWGLVHSGILEASGHFPYKILRQDFKTKRLLFEKDGFK